MDTFRATLGLACVLLVIVTFQPFRSIAPGRAGEQALAGSPAAPAALTAAAPDQAVWLFGVLESAPDARRPSPVEPERGSEIALRPRGFTLSPGTWLRVGDTTITLDGDRIVVAGPAIDYAYGETAAVYGAPRTGGVEVWAMAPDAAGLAELAQGQTALLRWPWALLGIGLAVVGYALAAAAAVLLWQALFRGAPLRPRLAGAALALYLLCGYGLLGSAWAMLWPSAVGLLLAAALAAANDRRPVPTIQPEARSRSRARSRARGDRR